MTFLRWIVCACLISTVVHGAFFKKLLEARMIAQMLNNNNDHQPNFMMTMIPEDSRSSGWKGRPTKLAMNPQSWHTFEDVDPHYEETEDNHFKFTKMPQMHQMMKIASMMPQTPTQPMQPSSEESMVATPISDMPYSTLRLSNYLANSAKTNGNAGTNFNSEKLSMSNAELESLVTKMKQLNTNLDDVSEVEMKKMIINGLSKPISDESFNESEKPEMNVDEMDYMNIMKPADRLPPVIEPKKPFLNHSDIKDDDKTSIEETLDSMQMNEQPKYEEKPIRPTYPPVPDKLPRYPMPIPPARFTIQQKPYQHPGLMSRMPQMLRSAMNSFGFGVQHQRHHPIPEWSSMNPYLHNSMPTFNMEMHPGMEAMLLSRVPQYPSKQGHPAYLGSLKSYNKLQAIGSPSQDLGSHMDKLMLEMERKQTQNPFIPGPRTQPVQQATRLTDVADLKANRGDLRRLNRTESSIASKAT